MEQTESAVGALRSPSEYQTERETLFPSPGALSWFMRRHRSALTAAAALVVVNRRLLVVPDRFDRVVLEVGAQIAEAQS